MAHLNCVKEASDEPHGLGCEGGGCDASGGGGEGVEEGIIADVRVSHGNRRDQSMDSLAGDQHQLVGIHHCCCTNRNALPAGVAQ